MAAHQFIDMTRRHVRFAMSKRIGRNAAVTEQSLERENLRHRGTGGRSADNRSLGFRPAFQDLETRAIYLSRFANGCPAPCHVLDGLPRELVLRRRPCGRVAAVKPSLVSGFVRDGCFYTREEAALVADPAH